MIIGANTNEVAITRNTEMFFKTIILPDSEENTNILKGLIENGINFEHTKENLNPLHWSVIRNHSIIVQQLLDKGADINARDHMQDTSLHIAILYNRSDMTQLLLDRGADTQAMAFFNCTPLHLAADFNRSHLIQPLLDKGADIEARDEINNTPLLIAIGGNNYETAMVLLDNKADVNVRNALGITPFHYAAQSGNRQLIQQLLNKGANITAKDNDNNTPLHFATKNSDADVFEWLLDNGADFEAKNNDGDTPLKFALNKSELGKYLLVVIKKIAAAGRFDYLQEAFFAHFSNKNMTPTQQQAQNEIMAHLTEAEAFTTEEAQITEEKALDTPEMMVDKIVKYSIEEQFKMIQIVEQQYANAKLFTTSLTSKMLFASNVDDLMPSPTLLLSQNLQRTTLTESEIDNLHPVIEDLLRTTVLDSAIQDFLAMTESDQDNGHDFPDTARIRP